MRAWIAVSVVAKAVTITTATVSLSSFRRRSVSSPSMPGILRSTSARSAGASAMALSASGPDAAATTSKPSRPSVIVRNSRRL